MPERKKDPDVQHPQSSTRSPRFHEDFDAPFSEALVNASSIPPATDTAESSPSSQHYSSISIDSMDHPHRPAQSREDSWSSTYSRRSTSIGSGVNDRIRDWARRSFHLPRRRSDDGECSRLT
ncbi:hypothetical protein QQS21_001555 [Conoideocrella luteorostrata]|uniref:Uncharacterized protein n=1 Tax=Conoideocrella luteorostrata TaxID=1105319 RepID=A0AAJ0G3D7_9HYPO|nr:hypothetical protein QQS21_001555 [Conoideocrella luteorostrata]